MREKTQIKWQDICRAIIPALLYTFLSNIIYAFVSEAVPESSKIIRQAAALAACLLFFTWLAMRERLAVRDRKGVLLYRFPASFCYAMAAVMCGIAGNYLISLMDIADASSGYRRAAEIFYGNSLAVEIAALCILGPLVEELVYRGFVYQNLRGSGWGRAAAAVFSALLFGVLHFNIVQGIYAFVLGLLLAHIAEQMGGIVTVAAAHMATNLLSVLRTETGWPDILNRQGPEAVAAMLLSCLLTFIFLSYGNRLQTAEKFIRHGKFGLQSSGRVIK